MFDLSSFEREDIGFDFWLDLISTENTLDFLFKDGLIRMFIEDDSYDEIIKIAIEQHNKYKERVFSLKELVQKGLYKDASASRLASGRKPALRFAIPLVKPIQFEEKSFKIKKTNYTRKYYNRK